MSVEIQKKAAPENNEKTKGLLPLELSKTQFKKITQLVHGLCGINLHSGKEELVKGRLMKRLRALEMDSFEQYIRYIGQDKTGLELSIMINALTTNKTNFFREPQHFDFLRQKVLPEIKNHSRMRFWSAGCSSGEEPFSIAMVLREELLDTDLRDVQILGTDISVRMLEKARDAIYEQKVLRDVSPHLLQKYFTPLDGRHLTGFTCVQTGSPRAYQVNNSVRSLVRLARLNLMDRWSMRGPFNVIFCRNVMIYFDKPTQQQLIPRFWKLLEPGGYLFVGHSESLLASSHKFHYVQPAVYVK